ncbi:cystathionine gamma-synthase [Lapillicoccus jejuensis]|uniref:Cystathionine gamma-synthase n=1 Tax=Lapillicoccus jejuensis TaxID=402171 RepID=A0A542E1S2_9MICO|nr:cystathionine gamma-synthase [Lapillicoccus jejuensis]TQJ09287.1 cystathionine gamma-synthase [Lapillicoccus jejuensis]
MTSEHHPQQPQQQHQQQGFATRAIHAGQDPDASTGAVVTPIYQVSTYKQDGIGGLRGGYEYSRSGNPTRNALEECLAALEGGERGFAFASGLAGQDTIVRSLLSPGDHLVIGDDAYGGTYRYVSRVAGPAGLAHSVAPTGDLDAVRAAIQPGRTKLVWVETPSNPLLGVSDIAALAEIAHEADALLVVDNTFATAYLQNPIAHGADVVTHSTTKYSGGHSDVVGGGVVVRRDVAVPSMKDAADRIAFHQNAIGGVAGPFDSWLVLRGLKTLAVRMEKHCDNAEAVVRHLQAHPAVEKVLYPGLPEHRHHDVAARQMRRFGGMVSVLLRGGEDAAVRACGATTVFTLAESLGGIESLIEHPFRMTHASVEGTDLEVPRNLVRLSVGIEDEADLLADLDVALAAG